MNHEEKGSFFSMAARLTLPQALADIVVESLFVPQWGSHHREGPYLQDHLASMMDQHLAIAKGHFHPEVPEGVRSLISAMHSEFTQALQFILLHDLEKMNCLTLHYEDGTKRAITWPEWLELIEQSQWRTSLLRHEYDGVPLFCAQEHKIAQISYYQEIDGHKRHHGPLAADRLREYQCFSEVLLRAIDLHEVVFQFPVGGINIPLAQKYVQSWPCKDLDFLLLVTYIDQAASIGQDGQPQLGNYIWFAKSCLAMRQYERLLVLVENAHQRGWRVDKHVLNKALQLVCKAPDAFESETAGQVFDRLHRDYTLPSVTREQVLQILAPFNLMIGLKDLIASDMVRDGKISSTSGAALADQNKAVRAALNQLR